MMRNRPQKPPAPRGTDYLARFGVLTSLVLGLASLGLAWYNTRIQDTDRLLVVCRNTFTGHRGFNWPATYPVAESIKADLAPVMLTECDLSNAGRRTLSVVRFAVGGRASDSGATQVPPIHYGEPDSSILGLPLNIAAGESRRLAMLLAMAVDSDGYESFHLVPPNGRPLLLDFRAPPGDSTSRSVRWDFSFRFATALGQSAEHTIGILDFGQGP